MNAILAEYVSIPPETPVCCLDCANRSVVSELMLYGSPHCPRCGSPNFHLTEPRYGVSLEFRPEGTTLQ